MWVFQGWAGTWECLPPGYLIHYIDMADSLEAQIRARLHDRPPDFLNNPDRKIQRRPQAKGRGVKVKARKYTRPEVMKDFENNKGKPMDKAEMAAICALVLDGNSISQVAELTGRSPHTISRALATQGVVSMHPTPEAAHAAIADYSMERRRLLINMLFDKTEKIVAAIDPEDPSAPRNIKDLASATGIMIDKRRLEDGEATARSESGPIGEARVSLATKLDAIVRNRETASEVTYEAVEDTGDAPGELLEMEQEVVYVDDEDPMHRDSTWGLVGE